MPICPICDDTGLQNSDPANPEFCFCSAGKQARRQWEIMRAAEKQGQAAPKPASFIDITQLEEVNASVDALRASLLGSASTEAATQTKHPAVQLLYQVAHPGHEISVVEATQLHDLAKTLELFLTGLAPIGRKTKR
ncbi:hypothetical protein KSF_014850 [Reticulibacter mediterranei]|uniref:Uncharacterized protein n=1 Tax=Reticulibacter mediterranei TaxID=2778369 RepID=A0A8J3IH87_9CHLR|nr:hypothetical protein [Reticulibacter mediterranei]GHO91437.1 hypothetical protein KSF_014850 [Reticulibacter mediterranei]